MVVWMPKGYIKATLPLNLRNVTALNNVINKRLF